MTIEEKQKSKTLLMIMALIGLGITTILSIVYKDNEATQGLITAMLLILKEVLK